MGIQRRLGVVFGTVWTVVLMVAALWAWQNAGRLVEGVDPERFRAASWAVRSGAVAAAAAAQVVLLTFVVGAVYRRRDRVSDLLRWGAAGVCTVAIVGAVALGLGLAGR